VSKVTSTAMKQLCKLYEAECGMPQTIEGLFKSGITFYLCGQTILAIDPGFTPLFWNDSDEGWQKAIPIKKGAL
jgi:hypothetical protein